MKYCTVVAENNVPVKLIQLAGHFSKAMLKKGFQFRVGDDDMSIVCMTAVCNEGQYFSVDCAPWMLCENVNTPDIDARSASDTSDTNLLDKKTGISLMTGTGVCRASSVVLIWSRDGAKSVSTTTTNTPAVIKCVISQAAKYKVPLLNLALPEHRAKVMKIVKDANKKSAVQQLAANFRR